MGATNIYVTLHMLCARYMLDEKPLAHFSNQTIKITMFVVLSHKENHFCQHLVSEVSDYEQFFMFFTHNNNHSMFISLSVPNHLKVVFSLP